MSFVSRRVRRLAVACFGTVLAGVSLALPLWAETEVAPQADVAAIAAVAQQSARSAEVEAATPGSYDGDVRDLAAVTYTTPRYWHMWNDMQEPLRIKPPSAARAPSGVQAAPAAVAAMPATSITFAGLGFSDSVAGGSAGAGWPPDVNGDVGPTVYVQSVNDAFAIYSKSNGSRLAAFTEDQLWSTSGSSTPCNNLNEGDPVVLHDGLSDRWILTDFAFGFDGNGNPTAPYYECIAVSKTSDPVSGGWWFYAVHVDTGAAGAPPVGTLGDYPKFGLWTDCLYMGANGFDASGSYSGAIFATFSRSALFAGQALTSSNSSLGFLSGGSAPFAMFPANLLGTSAASLPPSGTPEYFVAEGGTTSNAWEVRKYTQGANVCGAGGTLGAVTYVSQTQYGYPANIPSSTSFDSNIVPQRSTSNTLDSLGDRVMQKVQYRKVGSAESLWVVHTTCGSSIGANGGCATGAVAQPQWAQINVTNKTISTSPVQQQIYAPDSTQSRWMGSLAVDAQGNMALGYSISSSTMFPSIAYSGRLATDTLNQLPQTETILQAGGASQINTPRGTPIQRWGDYSAMSVDPADDCTFWYTNEYYDTAAHGSVGNWQTRIGAFKFPNCSTAIVGTKLVVTQQPNASYASNAAITLKVSIEDANGNVATGDTSAVTLALSGGTSGATLGGTKTVNAVAGVATFSNLTVDKVGSGYQLSASDGALAGTSSNAFAITAGTPTAISWSTQPSAGANIAAGSTIALVAHVRDAANNNVAGQSVKLALGANPGSATLSVGTNPVTTDANGNAAFSGVSLNKTGTGYTLTATDQTVPLNVTGNSFNIVAGAASTLAFTTQPAAGSNVVAGANVPLAVHVADANGNAVANQSIQLALANNPGSATLSVTTNPMTTDSSGNASFAGVSLNRSGSGYTLKATDNSVASLSVTGNAFNVVAGAPAQLQFVQQPGNGVAGVALSPAVTLRVVDALGNVVTSDSSTVTLNVTGPGGFDPSATTSAALANGVATFANLVFRNVGTGYSLGASDGTDGLTSAPSNSFAVVAGAPRLVFTTEPADVSRGGTLNTIAVTEVDGTGAAVTADSTSAVDFTIAACGGTIDLGSVTMANGVATLGGAQAFFNLASGLTVQASSTGLSGTSHTFNVVASELVFDDSFDGCRL